METGYEDLMQFPVAADLEENILEEFQVNTAANLEENGDILKRVEAWLDTITDPTDMLTVTDRSSAEAPSLSSPASSPTSNNDSNHSHSSHRRSCDSAATSSPTPVSPSNQRFYPAQSAFFSEEFISSYSKQTMSQLNSLRQNPLFTELQNTLATECLQMSSHYHLPPQMSHTNPADDLHLRDQVMKKHVLLLQQFRTHSPDDSLYISQLHKRYKTDTTRLEAQRNEALTLNIGNEDSKHSVNTYYSMEYLNLIGQYQNSISVYASMSRLSCSFQSQHQISQLCTQNVTSTPTDSQNAVHSVVIPGVTRKSFKPSRNLNRNAITIMNDWYIRNIHHPYPSNQEKARLARLGGITEKQVRYWFAHKRSRSKNKTSPATACYAAVPMVRLSAYPY